MDKCFLHDFSRRCCKHAIVFCNMFGFIKSHTLSRPSQSVTNLSQCDREPLRRNCTFFCTHGAAVIAGVRRFFLHGSSRHVCKECTGQLVLLVNESPARKGQKQANQTSNANQTNQTNQTNKQNHEADKETQVGHAEVKQK